MSEFFRRWGEGIRSVTPYQTARVTFLSNFLILTGLVFGIVVSVMSGTWWLALVLTGGLIITTLSQVGQYQKMVAFKKIEGGFDE